MDSTRSPFDDVSGKELLQFLANNGGVGAAIREYVAAGTTLATAASTGLGTVSVTAAAANTGVRLSSSIPVGQSVLVYNGEAARAVKLYPPDDTQQIGDEGLGVAISVNALTSVTLTRISDVLWIVTNSA